MSAEVLFILLKVFGVGLAVLYISIICTKIWQKRRTREHNKRIQMIKTELNSLLQVPEADFRGTADHYVTSIQSKMKRRTYRLLMEEVLLEYLESSGQRTANRARIIAYDLELPYLCLSQIRSRNRESIVFGCRKAGLYRYTDAIPDMLTVLDVFSSETQFQVLMGLSRIGDVSAMVQAFDTISKYIIVNERAVFEILASFSGDQNELYRRMVKYEVEYVAMLFLKSIDKDTAKALSDDIVSILESGSKETRVAAVKAIAKMEDTAPTKCLIQALADDHWEVRAIAAKTLGQLTDLDASEALTKAVCDPEWWVRQNAATALLSYPDCTIRFNEILETKDAYAIDSIKYALNNTERMDYDDDGGLKQYAAML